MHESDLDAVLSVQAECYPETMRESANVIVERLRAAASTCVVAVDRTGICGYLFAYPSVRGAVTVLGGSFILPARPDTLYLHDLAVARRALGNGLAGSLVAHLTRQAQSQGLSWSALASVQETAGFWERLGYCICAPECPEAQRGLASYPGVAQYMIKALTPAGRAD